MLRKKWTEEEVEKLKNSYLNMSTKELSLFLDRTEISIIGKMQLLGINRMWTKNEDDILRENYGINNYEDYKYLLPNRTLSSLFNRAQVLKIKCKEKIRNNYKYDVNHHFFKDLSNINCYWAGFIAADGWIKSDCNCLGVKLAKKDIKHLEKFKFDIQSNSPIREKKAKIDEKIFLQSEINVYSRYIVHDLYDNFNITPNKTFTLIPPNIENFEHKISYIVGLIDGDGTIGKKTNATDLRISLAGNEEIIKWCKSVLVDLLKLRKSKKIAYSNKIYSFSLGNKNSIKFINYAKKLNIPHMERKWNRYGLQ